MIASSHIWPIALFAILLSACKLLPTLHKKATPKPAFVEYRPQPMSPLAAHMRYMTHYLDSIRPHLPTAQVPLPNRHFSKILTAEATHPHMKDSSYYLYAHAFLRQYDHFRQHPDTASYNGLISLCQACHQHHCPGPLLRIEKLYWTDR